jgi:hypothetical protein
MAMICGSQLHGSATAVLLQLLQRPVQEEVLAWEQSQLEIRIQQANVDFECVGTLCSVIISWVTRLSGCLDILDIWKAVIFEIGSRWVSCSLCWVDRMEKPFRCCLNSQCCLNARRLQRRLDQDVCNIILYALQAGSPFLLSGFSEKWHPQGSESHIAHTDKVPAALLALWAWVIAGWSLCYKASVAEQWPCSRSLASRPFGVSPKWIPNSVQTL